MITWELVLSILFGSLTVGAASAILAAVVRPE